MWIDWVKIWGHITIIYAYECGFIYNKEMDSWIKWSDDTHGW